MIRLIGILLLANSLAIIHCANPNYSYHVNIEDPVEVNYQQKAETRLGDKTEGFYSVLEPNGAMRTVSYVSDEFGFRPTISYTYGHPVPPVKKIVAAPTVALVPGPTATTIVKQPLQPLVQAVPSVPYQQLYNPPTAIAPVYHNFLASGNQYSHTYGTPVFSVKDHRVFLKNPAQVSFASPVIKTPIQTLVSSPLKTVVATPPAHTFVSSPQPIIAVKDEGYSYPPPPPPKNTYLPPKDAYLPPKPPKEGYNYPVPEKKLEYPNAIKIQPISIQQSVELPAPQFSVAPPQPAIIKAQPPVFLQQPQFAQFGARLHPQPPVVFAQQNFVQPAAPLPQPQPIAFAPQRLVTAVAPQPIQYTHNQATVFHQQIHKANHQAAINYYAPQPQFQQVHYAPNHMTYAPPQVTSFINQQPLLQAIQPAQQIVKAEAPVVQRYEDLVIQNQDVMRYAEAPVQNYLPPLHQAPQPQPLVIAKAPASPLKYFQSAPAQQVLVAGKQNPLTFKYGYDNGVSKVSHSYFGSGW